MRLQKKINRLIFLTLSITVGAMAVIMFVAFEELNIQEKNATEEFQYDLIRSANESYFGIYTKEQENRALITKMMLKSKLSSIEQMLHIRVETFTPPSSSLALPTELQDIKALYFVAENETNTQSLYFNALWHQDLKLEGEGLWVTQNIKDDKNALFFLIPIFNSASEYTGAIVCEIDIDAIMSVFLLDDNQNYEIVLDSNGNIIGENTIQNQNILKQFEEKKADIRNMPSDSGCLVYDEVFIGYAVAEELNWIICSISSTNSYNKSISNIDANIEAKISNIYSNISLMILVIIVLLIFFYTLFFTLSSFLSGKEVKKMTIPLEKLTEYAREIGKGNLDAQYKPENSEDEIQTLSDSFVSMIFSLKSYISRFKEETINKAHAEKELELANEIQQGFLPSCDLHKNNITCEGFMRPAKHVGGDLFDYIEVDGAIYFTVIDVSEKGVAASLFMSRTGVLFRIFAKQNFSPADILKEINLEITEDNPTRMFVTMFVGKIENNKLKYANAGHCTPIAVSDKGVHKLENIKALPLGISDGITYTDILVEFPKMVIVYSDGVTEALNPKNELYGENRLLSKIESIIENSSVKNKLHEIVDDVDRFADAHIQADDITLLIISKQ